MGHGTGHSQQTSTTVFNETNGLAELSSYLDFLPHDVPQVWNYKELLGIRVNLQKVVTILEIGTCSTCWRMYVPVTYHSYPT